MLSLGESLVVKSGLAVTFGRRVMVVVLSLSFKNCELITLMYSDPIDDRFRGPAVDLFPEFLNLL